MCPVAITRRSALCLGATAAVALPAVRPALAQEPPSKLSLLTPEQRRIYDAWKAARTFFTASLDAYWAPDRPSPCATMC
jgi:hypothetical protein